MSRRSAKVRRHQRSGQPCCAPTRVVFPGQGAMRDCMREMDARGLRDAVARGSARASPSSASASACRCCSSTARRATRRASACCPVGCGGFRRRKCIDCGRQQAQGAAHGLERGAPERRASVVGRHSRRQPLLFRAQLFRRARACRVSSPATASILSLSRARPQRGTFSPCSFTRKKARPRGCGCSRISRCGSPCRSSAADMGGGRRARLIRSGEHAVVSRKPENRRSPDLSRPARLPRSRRPFRSAHVRFQPC